MTERAADDLSFAQLVSELVAEAELLGRLVPGFVAPPALVRQRIAELGDVAEAAVRTCYAALVALRVPLLLLPEPEFPRDPEMLRQHVAGDRAAAGTRDPRTAPRPADRIRYGGLLPANSA